MAVFSRNVPNSAAAVCCRRILVLQIPVIVCRTGVTKVSDDVRAMDMGQLREELKRHDPLSDGRVASMRQSYGDDSSLFKTPRSLAAFAQVCWLRWLRIRRRAEGSAAASSAVSDRAARAVEHARCTAGVQHTVELDEPQLRRLEAWPEHCAGRATVRQSCARRVTYELPIESPWAVCEPVSPSEQRGAWKTFSTL
eukprot:COSAG01_NODE_604_length_14894_cov_24.503211_1_plen_195_part_10